MAGRLRPGTPLEPGLHNEHQFEVDDRLLTECTARATLREVIDGRKLFFDVDVVDGDCVIGVRTHQRRVVSVSVS